MKNRKFTSQGHEIASIASQSCLREKYPVIEFNPVLAVGRASPPGLWSGSNNPSTSVRAWIKAVAGGGFQTVVCLLSPEELAGYSGLRGGLLEQYRRAGFAVPTAELSSASLALRSIQINYAVAEAAQDLPRPVLLHCDSKGQRSASAFHWLARRMDESRRRVPTEAEDREIQRLIRNSDAQHGICALQRGSQGMEDYARLNGFFAAIDQVSLERYLGMIEEVRQSLEYCPICNRKLLAFCLFYSIGRVPTMHRAFRAKFWRDNAARPLERNLMAEVCHAILMARRLPGPRPTSTSYFHSLPEAEPAPEWLVT